MDESTHIGNKNPDSIDNSWKANEKVNFRKKQIQNPNTECPQKCTCTRHGDMVTDICPCLDDDYHMPMLKLEKQESTEDVIKEYQSSLTPGWEAFVHAREFEAENSNGSSLEYFENVSPVDRDQKIFCTGSSYVGQWDQLGMKGNGTYIMPHGVEYFGEFEDGQFHGNGTLRYPNGLKIRGVFEKGKMIKWDIQFADGLEYKVPWNYCKMPDRRFYPEILNSIPPGGRSNVTPETPPRKIPKGCYDTGDGYFDPHMKCIYSAYKPNKILRVASKLEEEWILANCRREEDCTTQYRPDLFTEFINGCDEYTTEQKKSTETLNVEYIGDDEYPYPYRYTLETEEETSSGVTISSQRSRDTANINVVEDKYTNLKFIDTENKSENETVDVKSFAQVDPTQKADNFETLNDALKLQSHFMDIEKVSSGTMMKHKKSDGVNELLSSQT